MDFYSSLVLKSVMTEAREEVNLARALRNDQVAAFTTTSLVERIVLHLTPPLYLPAPIQVISQSRARTAPTMAPDTKYQPAPQRDSFDETNYPHPPPSYQAEASTDAALLGGQPRSEDDNIPDDFKVRRVFV